MCQGQLLCKVSSSQLPLLQRYEVYSQTRRKFSRLDANCGQTDGRTNGRTDERTNGRKVEPLYRTLLNAGAIKIRFSLDMIKISFEGCQYDKSQWGPCDAATNTVTRTLTLKSGDPQMCNATKTDMQKCKDKHLRPHGKRYLVIKVLLRLMYEN